ncbi:MAG: 30S ribosome-binding factor RbfA [Syntrophobacteraceae bacterium]
MKTDYKRSDRVADVLQKEIADLVLRRVKDPRAVNLTVTGVQVTPDLKHARVFYCVMSGSADERAKQDAASGLEKAKGFIRQELGKRLRLRYIPQLYFEYDISFEYGDKIERLLKDIHRDE